jgi:hypothetical protein
MEINVFDLNDYVTLDNCNALKIQTWQNLAQWWF